MALVNVSAAIVISQADNSPPMGYVSDSREDIVVDALITLSNLNNSGVTSWKWELLSKPNDSTSSLLGANTASATFTPDLVGSYLIQLTVNRHIRIRAIAACLSESGIRFPANGESQELGGWDQAVIDAVASLEASVIALEGAEYESLGAHTLGGALHITDTLANLNLKITDATLDDQGSSRPPNGSASGQLGGSYPGPNVIGIRETSGPTLLTFGSISDGQILTRSGTTVIGSAPSAGGADSYQALISVNDTTPGYLEDKFVGTGLVTISTLNDGADEDLQIAVNLDGYQASGTFLDRMLVFSDDTEFTETGSSLVTKKTFRIVKDSEYPPTSWRIVVSLYVEGAESIAECQVNIGGDTLDTLITSTSGVEEVLYGDISTITALDTTLLTANIQLRVQGGTGTAHIKYTDIYAVFGTSPPVE